MSDYNQNDEAILRDLICELDVPRQYVTAILSSVQDDELRKGIEEIGSSFAFITADLMTLLLDPPDTNIEGEHESVAEDFLYAIMDQRSDLSADFRGSKKKYYHPGRTITKKKGICFHHTGVKGGFGVTKSALKKFSGGNSRQARWLELSRDLNREEYARAMALADRYGRTPYHAISGPNSVLVLNMPFDYVTWHGNRSNHDFLGYAWDASSKTDELERADVKKDILSFIKIAKSEGHFRDGLEFTCHCAWTNKPHDPGEKFMNLLSEIAYEIDAVVNWDFSFNKSCKSMAKVVGL